MRALSRYARFASILLGLGCLLNSTASAYYYYIQYGSGQNQFQPIVTKFDLTALNNNTVPFFVSDQGPTTYAPGDSFQAVVSELRAAAQVWNTVPSSLLQLSYGGLFTIGTVQNAPAITVEFSDDIPPGLLALSGPEVRGGVTQNSSGSFVPIQHSRMLLKQDLSQLPSFGELFCTTLVHEFGHTIGLQHTLTSSVMSTAVTSASTRANPLAADDIAGVSLLYPAPGYLATTGSISGRVTSHGKGVNLASVVAISVNNAAVSALTNPDGTFEIDGLQPMQYYIYVHPLPPPQYGETYPANIHPPADSNGNLLPAGPNFVTQFYPGTRNFGDAQWVFVYAQQVTSGINFSVTPEDTPPISAVQIYGYSSTNVPLPSAPLFMGVPAALVAGSTGGLVNGNSLAPGLNVSLLGYSAVVYNLQPWYQYYAAFDVDVANTAGPGPKHLVFSTPTDIYVRPSAFFVVQNPPPSIDSVTPATDNQGNQIALIAGSNLQPDTRIFFDGLLSTISGTASDGSLMVSVPPGPPGYTATVVALNTSDAQSSLFLQAPNPPTLSYNAAGTPVITASPQFLPGGADTLVDVVTQNTNFVSGQVVVGFGTSDAFVKEVNVLSPTHLTVLVTAPTGGWMPVSVMTITNGLAIYSQNLGFPILPEQPNQ